MLHSV